MKDLNITTQELIKMGYVGKGIGQVQTQLLTKVRLGELPNHYDDLFRLAYANRDKQ